MALVYTEKCLEQILCKQIRKHGGLPLKFVSPGMAGVPDRIVLMPKGKVVFVELKAPGKKMRTLQLKRKEQLETLGFKVYLIDSIQGINELIEEMIV